MEEGVRKCSSPGLSKGSEKGSEEEERKKENMKIDGLPKEGQKKKTH